MSWNYNLTSYEAKRLLNLPEESGLERATVMSENRLPVVTETTWKSSNPSNPPSAPITRSSSDVSLYMPVRRRSIIQTPGVATRSISVHDNPLPKLNFRHSHPASPALSRQQSFESYRSGVISMPPRLQDPDSVPRVVTPCDEQYRSIGTFKLGSLRITNGSPSPVTPEVSRNRGTGGLTLGNTVTQDGYFSGAQTSEAGAASSIQNTSRSPPEPNQPQPTSPALQTTSKVTALEDQLFEDETQPEYSSVEVLDVRLDPNAKSSHADVDREKSSTVSRTDSGFESTTSPSSEPAYKPLAKADSGYSSNVSLRSFHAKPQLPQSQGLSIEIEALNPVPPEREAPPPPVPPKDSPRQSPISQPNSSVAAAQKKRASASATRHVPVSIANLPSGDRGPASPESMPKTPGSAKSSRSSNSNLAMNKGETVLKPGRLQRFLSGTRRPAAAPPIIQTQHTPEQNAIPPVPREVQYKLHEHSGAFPSRPRRLALKPHSSMDTLKTIFSVGSIEASLDAVNSIQTGQPAAESETKEGLWKQTLHSVPTSIANVAAHVIPRKPISRKPVPARQEAVIESDELSPVKAASNSPAGYSTNDSREDETRPVSRSRRLRERTKSLTLPRKQSMNLRSPTAAPGLNGSLTDLPTPPLPSPVAKAMAVETKARAFPPINPGTRRPLSLRVPPPLRAQSSVSSVSRKTSRESMQSYSTSHYPTRKSSVESFHSYSPSQPSIADGSVHSLSPSGATMDPRRLQSFRKYQGSPSSPYGSPNWDVQNGRGLVRQGSQTFYTTGSRRNSISSVHTDGGYGVHRPSSSGWQNGTVTHPLRHRASYDGYSYQQRYPQYGYPPSMSNGYTAPMKPSYDPRSNGQLNAAATWSRSQLDAAAGQWYQEGGYPPYVPRGHYRNRSMGNRNGYGPNPPYRVLHSYNSPAYRNAPIWG